MLDVTAMLRLAEHELPPAALAPRAEGRYAPSPAVPPVVVWNVCRHCNLRCPHCYAAATAQVAQDDLDGAEARSLIDALAGAGVQVLILSGGEPLLRPDLLDLVAHAHRAGLQPQLSSGGVLLDRPRAERLVAAGVRYIGISLDGLAPFNDSYRGLPGAFARAVEGLGHAKAAGARTGMRVTLTRRNADQLDPLLELAVRLGVDRFYVSHLLYSGRGRGLTEEDLSPVEARALLLHLFEAARRLARAGAAAPAVVTGGNDSDGALLLRWVEERYGGEAGARVHDALLRRGGNSAGEKLLAIDHRGRVHPDQFWQTATLGNVREMPLAEILDHPLRAALRNREAFLEGRCGACAFRALCRGSHRERALARHGEMWAPDPACVMTDTEIHTEVPLAAGGTT